MKCRDVRIGTVLRISKLLRNSQLLLLEGECMLLKYISTGISPKGWHSRRGYRGGVGPKIGLWLSGAALPHLFQLFMPPPHWKILDPRLQPWRCLQIVILIVGLNIILFQKRAGLKRRSGLTLLKTYGPWLPFVTERYIQLPTSHLYTSCCIWVH